MKKYTLYIALFLLSACNVLDIDPETQISSETAISNAAGLETALTGTYNQFRSSSGAAFQAVGYLNGDNVTWTGTWAYMGQFNQHNVRPDNTWLTDVFSDLYETVNFANVVISAAQSIDDPALTDERRNQILGEAYFIRAITYFDLSRLWGGVQLVTEPTIVASDNLEIKRSSLEETQALVLEDLDQAENLLSETTDRNKITRKTVWALKARFHLYREEWELAESYSTKLIEDNSFVLVKPYSAFFANNASNTTESILELPYSTEETNSHGNYWQPPTNGGRYEWAPSDELVALLTNPEIGGNRVAAIGQTSVGKYYGNIYYRNPATDPSYILRIAEQYLIRAETRAHLGEIETGLDDLNQVRERAGLGNASAADAGGLLLLIENERRLEFALENHRWFDLVRTNRADEVLGVTDQNKWLMPIPIDAINADEGYLDQNEGY